MIIKNQLRPTMIRTNSRYRGPTGLQDYGNFVQEVVHDLKLLGDTLDMNEYTQKPGQTTYIQDNFGIYVSGTPGYLYSNIEGATVINAVKEDIVGPSGEPLRNLSSSDWVAYGNCIKTTEIDGVKLSSDGTIDPSGIRAQIQVDSGDIVYIRMAVKLNSGISDAFTLGSENINSGDGDLTKYKIPENGSIIYIDKRLYCKQRELINVNIDIHRLPEILGASEMKITDVQIKHMIENPLVIQPINGDIKSRINVLSDQLENIIKSI